MRLLMTTDTVGGVWTYATELTEQLLQRGVAVALIALGRTPSTAQQRWVNQMEGLWGDSFWWSAYPAALEWMNDNQGSYRDVEALLLQTALAFQPDVLHSNQYCFGAMPLTIPKMLVAHSDVLSWAAACKGEPLEPSAWLAQYCKLVEAGLRGAAAVVAPSHWMLGALKENFRLPDRTAVIANGRTLPPAAGPIQRKLQAVSVGRLWDEAKNIKLLASVRAPLPLFVAGDLSHGSATRPGDGGGTFELGPLAMEPLLQLFRESAIYICPSKYEPFGLAPLEAALCGCAVLANDIPSLRKVWGRGALYFQDASSLSEQLACLAHDPHLLLAAQGRSWARAQRYTAAAMAGKYLALYKTMIATGVAAHVA